MVEQVVGLAVALLGISVACILIQWSDQRARERQWRKQWQVFALREKYLLSQLAALRMMLLDAERKRAARELKYAKWREMAGSDNQPSAQALIDVDSVNECSAALQRFAIEERKLRQEAESLGYNALFINVMEDRHPPGINEKAVRDRWMDDNP